MFKLIKITQVCKLLGISRATLWRIIQQDTSFPKKRYISPNRVAFVEAEIHEWIQGAIKPKV